MSRGLKYIQEKQYESHESCQFKSRHKMTFSSKIDKNPLMSIRDPTKVMHRIFIAPIIAQSSNTYTWTPVFVKVNCISNQLSDLSKQLLCCKFFSEIFPKKPNAKMNKMSKATAQIDTLISSLDTPTSKLEIYNFVPASNPDNPAALRLSSKRPFCHGKFLVLRND